jgi:hypothetical protein
MGVRCVDERLPFFPDVYNEDWFSFIDHVAGGRLARVGNASQDEFNPFRDPTRAAREEFGDLLAEGLYALIGDGYGLSRATKKYWEIFSEARGGLMSEIAVKLGKVETHESVQAMASIRAAQKQATLVTGDHCVDFLAAWQHDREDLNRAANELTRVSGYGEALDILGLKNWRRAEFGEPDYERPRDLVEVSRRSVRC